MLFHHANALPAPPLLPFRDFLDTLKRLKTSVNDAVYCIFPLPIIFIQANEGNSDAGCYSLYVHKTLMLFHVLVKLRFLMSFETYLVFCVVVVGISISNPYPHGFSIEKGMMLCASSFCTRE